MTSSPRPGWRDTAAVGARAAGRFTADNGLPVLLLGFGMFGSFGHIIDAATKHGQSERMGASIALTIDLLAVVAAVEFRARRRRGVHWGHLVYPAVVAVVGVAVQLAANLSTAGDDPGSQFFAAWPAVAFLLAAGLVESRPGRQPAKPDQPRRPVRRQPRSDAAPTPAALAGPVPVAALDPAPPSRPVIERVPDTVDAGAVPAELVEAARDPQWRAKIKGEGGLMETYGWTERQAQRRVQRARELAATPGSEGARP